LEALSTIDFQVSLLLFVSLLGYFLATRLGQSIVIGEILVGVLMGPSVFGLVTYTDFVSALASMGAVFLLFVVGLETKFKEVYTVKSFVIAFFGVVLPWVGGFLAASLFGYNFVASLFAGTALTATSIAITAQVLKELGKLESLAAKAIIGAAVVDDVLGLLALSLASDVAVASVSFSAVFLTAVKAIAFLSIGALFGSKIIARVLERWNNYAERHKIPQSTFLAAIGFAFAYATVAELVGLSAIVGAFIAGVSLESVRIKTYREGAAYLEQVFAAIFFVSLGVLVNVNAALNAWLFVIVLTLTAVLTKLIGCWLPARALGFSSRDSLVVGVGMVPRGEVAMIVALIGLNAGFIDQGIYSSVLLMSLLTTIATPFWFKKLFEEKS